MNNQPNYQSEGGIGNINPDPAANPDKPLFTLIPYKGLTAAKIAAIIPKQVD